MDGARLARITSKVKEPKIPTRNGSPSSRPI